MWINDSWIVVLVTYVSGEYVVSGVGDVGRTKGAFCILLLYKQFWQKAAMIPTLILPSLCGFSTLTTEGNPISNGDFQPCPALLSSLLLIIKL